MPTCPNCQHRWYERNARLKDAADLAAQIDERLAAFGEAAEDVRLFVARARNARPRGMAVTLTIKTLDEFHRLHAENSPAFAHALRCVLKSDTFDWTKNNLTGYLSSIYKSTLARGVPISDRDKADQIATQVIGVWHRWHPVARVTRERCADLANGELVFRVVHALHRRGWLPADAPPHAELAGHIRQVLAEKAAKRAAIAATIDPPKTAMDIDHVAPELREDLLAIKAASEKRRLEREARERAVWGES